MKARIYIVSFAAIAIILTIAFRLFLTTGIQNHSNSIVIISAILYFVFMFWAGWILGRKDQEFLPLYELGFKYHLVTYLAYNGISEMWFLFNFQSGYESISGIHKTALIWGIFVLIHYFIFLSTRKHSINNLNKSDLFE